MTSVATGGPRIENANQEYKDRRLSIMRALSTLGIEDPNPYSDLWAWYEKWSHGGLPHYQSRRVYLIDLYQPLLDQLYMSTESRSTLEVDPPTGWARVDEYMEKIVKALDTSEDVGDFRNVGLLCDEALVSLTEAVYDRELHPPIDEVEPGPTDFKRMYSAYIAKELPGKSNVAQRQLAQASFKLAVTLRHKRTTATFRDAALCAEATRSLINMTAIIAGRREPE